MGVVDATILLFLGPVNLLRFAASMVLQILVALHLVLIASLKEPGLSASFLKVFNRSLHHFKCFSPLNPLSLVSIFFTLLK